jgi:apolipoprotein D and lipocalin family protein
MKLAPQTVAMLITSAVLFASWPSPVAAQTPPLTTVPSIDVARYQGTWYQLALYPNRFQQMCASNTRATYTLQPNGSLQVLNQCRNAQGKEEQALGQARPAKSAQVVDGRLSPAQLKVRFAPAWLSWLPMVWGDYWVIDLASDYRYAVVGEPRREFLWVLARNTQLSATEWAQIESRLREQGYDPAKLQREPHQP